MTSNQSEARIQRIIAQIRASEAAAAPVNSAADLCDEDPEDDLAVLPVLIADIEKHVGGDLLDLLDPLLISEFCMVSVARNDGTGQLLRSLVEAFMRAYSDYNTSDKAVQALLLLENLASGSPRTAN